MPETPTHDPAAPAVGVRRRRGDWLDCYISMNMWGADHWSTLAYIETVMVECGGLFQVGFDGRMRQNRRHFRVMQDCPKPKRPSKCAMGVVMELKHSTPLADGSTVQGHDDWCCVQDMVEAGLFLVEDPHHGPVGTSVFLRPCEVDDCEPGAWLRLSPSGEEIAAAVRAHKRLGGSFKTMCATPEMITLARQEPSDAAL